MGVLNNQHKSRYREIDKEVQLPEWILVRIYQQWNGRVIRLTAPIHLYDQGLVTSWTRTNTSRIHKRNPANYLYSKRDFGYPVPQG
jgi:hypothetical protein